MQICSTHYLLYIFVSVKVFLIRVSAISISKPSLGLVSSDPSSLNASHSDIPISNITSFGAIDPAFGFVPIFYGVKLRPIPCLLNSVNAALELALEDYEGPIFETVFKLDAHPQVEIAFVPDEEGGSVPRKFVIWGLNIGIDLMIADRNFQAAVFILSYRGRGVACIKFTEAGASSFNSTDMTKTTEGDIQISSPLSNLTKVLPQAPKDAATTSANPQNDPRLEIAFQLTGSVVTIYEIFFMALDMLRDIAFSRRTARLADGATLIKAANLIISTRQTDPPRTAQDPPFFQVEWFMRALARTPAYMLDQRNFKEVEMVLFVEEVKVGEVSVRRPGTGSGLLPASDGLSTS